MITDGSLLRLKNHFQVFIAVTLILKCSQGFSGIPALGNCSSKLPAPDNPIDIRKLTGVWYESERWSNLQEWPFKCITIKVSHFYEMRSEVTYTRINRYTEKHEQKTFPLRAASDANDGKLILGSSEFDPKPGDTNIQVLNTDYHNWGIIWSCNPYIGANAHSEMVWVFTRQREPSEETLSKIETSLVSFHLENKRLYDVPQTDCDKPANSDDQDE